MILSYLKYLLQRKSKYKVHSPFVYDFMTKVLYDNGANRDYDTILRTSRLLDGKKYATFARRKKSRFLYRMVRHFEPHVVVSFGQLSVLNTTALALGNLLTKVYLDQSSDFLDTLISMGIVNVNLFRRDKPEEEQLERLNLDFVYFGLNDFGDDTWNKLDEALTQANEDTILLFEGIHHSPRTEAAWEAIMAEEDVTLSIDIYSFGMVFFREGMEKQDFVLKY